MSRYLLDTNIAHALTEKLTLISSDRKIEAYTSQRLKFVFNER